MRSLEKIKKLDWAKRWSEPVLPSTGTLLNHGYLSVTKKVWPVSFRHVAFVIRDGVLVCYRLQSDTNKIGRYLSRQLKNRTSEARKWIAVLQRETRSLLRDIEFHKSKKSHIEHEEYIKLEANFDNYLPIFTRVNIVPDYLSPSFLEKIQKDFERGRIFSESSYREVDSFYRHFILLIAKKEKRKYKYLKNILRDELIKYLETGILPDDTKLKLRDGVFGVYQGPSRTVILTPKQCENFEKIISKKIGNKSLITGKSASPGKVSGIVKIVLNPGKETELKGGYVLVTGMTNPDFLPLMKSAAAVVTDAGGVLSHAAIVSRELGIPCVVGTKAATTRLKDGDLVEVNAEKGVVKIIK